MTRYRASLVVLLLLEAVLAVAFLQELPRASAQSPAGALTLNPGEDNLYSAVIDSAGRYAYFGTNSVPGFVVKVNLSNFTRAGGLSPGVNGLFSAVIDSAAGFAYFGTDNGPANNAIVKVRLSNFTVVGTLNTGALSEGSAVIDPAAGYAYFGSSTSPSPGVVLKIRLSNFTVGGVLNLNAGEDHLASAVIDTGAGFAYFGTLTHPGIVVKIRLSDFTRVGNLTMSNNLCCLVSSVIDPSGGFAYFGTGASSIARIRLSDFTLAGVLPVFHPGVGLAAAVINSAGGYAYFGTKFSYPGVVVKIRLSDFALVSNLTLSSGEYNFDSAVIDPEGAYAYFGTATSPGIVVKIAVAEVSGVPSPPQNLQAQFASYQVNLSWSPPNASGGSEITGYNLYGGTCGDGEMLLANLGPQLSYNETKLTAGTNSCYTVTAKNKFGESPPSPLASVFIPFPDLPPPTGTTQPPDATIDGTVKPSISWAVGFRVCKDAGKLFPTAASAFLFIDFTGPDGPQGTIFIYKMFANAPTIHLWCVSLAALFPHHGPAQVYIQLTMAGGQKGLEDWSLFFDPSGFIKDATTGAPISGATVTLESCTSPTGPCSTPMAGSYQPNTNPETTSSTGSYGWNVTAGFWRVHVDAAAYQSADSPIVQVPPPVTDLNISLTPNKVCASVGPLGCQPISPVLLVVVVVALVVLVLGAAVVIVRRRRTRPR